MSKRLLQVSGVSKSFGAVTALNKVSFDLHAHEVHALVGENGAGKSTLIKLITGAHAPDSGTITLDGTSFPRLTTTLAHRLGIAAIYQQPALFAELSIAENIALGCDPVHPWRLVRWSDRRARARELLKRLGVGLDPEREAGDLSMPEQQLVELARALGAGARILIMDEPTASLGSKEVDALLTLIRTLRNEGKAIIYISHRLEELGRVADRTTVLRDGNTVATLERPIESASARAEVIHLMIGRQLSAIYAPREAKPAETVLQVRSLGFAESGIHDVSFDLKAGEVLGLAGLVGSGRTGLARILFGITPADTGQIIVGGRALKILTPRDAVEAGIAYVPEDRPKHGVIPQMPVDQNISLAVLGRLFPNGWLRRDDESALARRAIRDLQIRTSSPDALVTSLSGGNQQKIALARWLAAEPKILILDEPTQGIDIGAKTEIHRIIRRLSAQGMAVLLISSELPELLGMSDRIAVMHNGSIPVIYDAHDADSHQLMAAALGQTG